MKRFFILFFLCIILISCAKNHKVLLFIRDGSAHPEYMLTNEVGTMKELLEKSGYHVTIATLTGKVIKTDSVTLKPDIKLSQVNINHYAGFIFPCMAAGDSINPEAINFAKKIVDGKKPIAAQLGSVLILAKAGALKGKKYAFADDKNWNSKMYPELEESIFSGTGVIQDGNIITSGTCPWMARISNAKDGTTELTQQLIASMHSK